MNEEYIAKLRANPKWYKEDKEKVLAMLEEAQAELEKAKADANEARAELSDLEITRNDDLNRIAILTTENENLKDMVSNLDTQVRTLEDATGVEISKPGDADNPEPPTENKGARVFNCTPIDDEKGEGTFPGHASSSVLQVIAARENEMVNKMLSLSKELDLAMLKSYDLDFIRKIVAHFMPFVVALRNYSSSVNDLIKMVTTPPAKAVSEFEEDADTPKKEKISFSERVKKIGAWFKPCEPVNAEIEPSDNENNAPKE